MGLGGDAGSVGDDAADRRHRVALRCVGLTVDRDEAASFQPASRSDEVGRMSEAANRRDAARRAATGLDPPATLCSVGDAGESVGLLRRQSLRHLSGSGGRHFVFNRADAVEDAATDVRSGVPVDHLGFGTNGDDLGVGEMSFKADESVHEETLCFEVTYSSRSTNLRRQWG